MEPTRPRSPPGEYAHRPRTTLRGMAVLGALLVAGLLALAAPVVVGGGVAALVATAGGVAAVRTTRTLRQRRASGHRREVCLPNTRVCVAV